MRLWPVVLLFLAMLGCSGDGGAGSAPDGAPSESVTFDAELRDELLAMMDQDQRERTGHGTIDDTERTARMKEIIEEHGWPTYDLVGKKGEEAAWVLAQHADLDPEFQQQALELLRAAVAEGQASPGNLAYLEDRVAVAQGQPQQYGTQMGCRRQGPVPATPIEDRAGLDERREEAGLEPFAAYLREMTKVCALPE
jgi:hypothetical protein